MVPEPILDQGDSKCISISDLPADGAILTPMNEQIAQACRNAFPERDRLSINGPYPVSSNRHTVEVFHLRWEDDQEPNQLPVIYRRYPCPLGWHTFDDPDRAERELAVLKWLREQGFPAPNAYAAGQDDGGAWLLVEAISGKNWWMPLGTVDFNRVLGDVVHQQIKLMAHLHSLESSSLGAAQLPTITALDVIDTHRSLVEPSDDSLNEVFERIAALMAQVDEEPTCLVNVDAEPANMLVDPESGQIVAWLDWDEAAIGDRRWDLAALINALYGKYSLPNLADQVASQYAKYSVRPIRQINAWAALVAALEWAQASWLKLAFRQERPVDFPARQRMIDDHDSHRVRALDFLAKAEEEID
jgi:aminoglycoside phosphotransferase (APT) family kinase protein